MLHYFQDRPQIDIAPQLPQVQAQTLILVGDRDPIVAPAQSYEIARLIPNAELTVFKGAGHLPFLERTAEYNQSMSDW
ncbi:MAG: alpha/beta fold hydrolase [Anaerolineales bacterium]|nr:alpha/beta fold hydrolase [Anaerolineales bacterium]